MKTQIIVFVVPVVLLGLALAGGSSLLLRLFFLSALVPLTSYLWTTLGMRSIGVRAEKPPEHCQVGESFNQEITIINNSKMPKFGLKVEDNTDMPGHRNADVLNLWPGGSHHWQTSVNCRRRGRYSLGSVTVTATDPFGLFSKQHSLGEPYSILVYPATFDVPLFKLSSFNDFGYGSGYQSISQISPNASSVREFASGDSLHHIHWQSTAHTGKLMVKVFDADRSRSGTKTVWVVVDMQEASHAGKGEETTEEYGITIAASLIKKYLQSGMRVGMVASGDQIPLLPPERGEEHLWLILKALASVKATDRVPVSQLIYQQMQHFQDDSVVIIITPSATGQLLETAKRLKNRVGSIIVVLLDAASFGGEASPANIARSLSLTGVQVYIVRQGDELSRVFNDRLSLMRVRYV